MSISEYSGVDLGFGVVTAVAGLALAAIGLSGVRLKGVSRHATSAGVLAVLSVAGAGASVIWMYLIPGDDKEFYGPPLTTFLVVLVGLIALVASLGMRRSISPRG